MNVQVKYELYRAYFERVLGDFCESMQYRPAILSESMRYSLLAGGKRIRPVLFLSALDMLGVDFRTESRLAIECVHTYSLIHDDLPAMDNDDFRRGKPSNHKMFGEANAILAGDALLTAAFELALSDVRTLEEAAAVRLLAEAAGPNGMVAGQSADLLYENGTGDAEALRFIHLNKTGRMIAAPLRMAATVANVPTEPFENFGNHLGLLFQLTDDLLDANHAGDEEQKLTAVRLYGMEKARAIAVETAQTCRRILETLPYDTKFLDGVVEMVLTRDH